MTRNFLIKKKFFGALIWSLLFHLTIIIPLVLSLFNLKVKYLYLNFLTSEEFYIDNPETPDYRPISKSINTPYRISYKNVKPHHSELSEDQSYNVQMDKTQVKEDIYESSSQTIEGTDFRHLEKYLSDISGNQRNDLSKSPLHILPKRVIYEIFYGPIKLGETQLIIEENKIKALVYTTGMGNTIYPFFASWETWIDPNGLPKKTWIYSKDSEKERKKEVSFEVENSVVRIKRLLPEEKPEEIHKLPYPLYDELSSFINSWLVDYSAKDKVSFPVYIKERREIIEVSLKKKAPCQFKAEEKVCLELLVLTPEKSELLKRAREITVYLLEKEKIPVEIKGKIPLFGSLTGRLKELSW